MEISYLFKGMLLGFCLAAPVGPIGLLCIRRTLNEGHLAGFFSGLGAALADTFYGTLAAYGITLISDFLINNRPWFNMLGGIALIFLGIKTFLRKMKEKQSVTHTTLIKNLVSTFFLTLSSPITLIAFITIFASFGAPIDPGNAPLLSCGVFIGSSFWWFILSTGLTLFRHRITDKTMVWVNRVAGCILTLFGIGVFIYALTLF